MERESKGKKTLAIVAIALLGFAVAALVSLRPAALFGVDGPSLTHSLGGGDGPFRNGESECEREREASMWRCSIFDGGSASTVYLVRTQDMGCWDAWRGDRSIDDRAPTDSGCIHLLDVILRN